MTRNLRLGWSKSSFLLFLIEGAPATRCFLPDQKIWILAKVIAFSNLNLLVITLRLYDFTLPTRAPLFVGWVGVVRRCLTILQSEGMAIRIGFEYLKTTVSSAHHCG